MLAIAGGKGGAGKTTTALGLASALDGPTLVVDGDVDMPALHLLAGVARTPTLADVGGTAPSVVAQPRPGDDRVAVLPAPRSERVDGVEVDTALAEVRRASTATLVDCPGGTGPDAARALRTADATLLVSTACAPALRDTARTAAMSRALGTPVVGALLTRTLASPSGVADLLDCPLLGSVPDVTPPVLSDDRVRAAYDRLGGELESDGSCLVTATSGKRYNGSTPN